VLSCCHFTTRATGRFAPSAGVLGEITLSRKVDPQRLDLASYAHHFSVDTQFGDVDSLGHVNNLAVARYYESARARFQMGVFGDDMFALANPLRVVLVENRTSYLAEVHFPQALVVGSGFSHLGNSSYVCSQALFRDGVCVGLCDATLVSVVDGKPAPLSEAHRQLMAMRMIAPQTA
jgi:acyl-CoA thioester hydrolase